MQMYMYMYIYMYMYMNRCKCMNATVYYIMYIIYSQNGDNLVCKPIQLWICLQDTVQLYLLH